MKSQTAIDQATALFEQANRVLFITGAGISADSDLPVYRGIGGLYNVNMTEEGLTIEEALSGEMLNSKPEVTWGHIARIEAACRGASYNRGHEVIALLEAHLDHVCVFTQNVDGFHRGAGSSQVIDIHGDVYQLLCTQCNFRETVADYSHLEIPPKCTSCNGLIRPDVVLFGELLDLGKLELLQAEANRGFDLVVSIGTSSLFPYIMQPVIIANQLGVPTLEINPGETELSDMVDVKVSERAAVALEAIYQKLVS
ncbi:NAD-dependent protein deacylase [Acanthopleuribacter pedis]|uniref:protein acetyllysine N-acetyltransferase n=1 Tax=Acanthopleuribacter pedis TaxID=442870 RepID=A0A8J7U190_9BACT|nr:NAD-dependent protein deacylase [Acanthopleuribacter pedis]MBO1317913.1 NAD-dependent protein deacylase [Acanthopleuribacter pedis]